MSAPDQKYCLRWNNHQSNLLNVFDELLRNEKFTDVILALDSGQTIKCHKIVLAACSTYFQTLFLSLPSMDHVVVLKDIKFAQLKAVLEYMYRGQVNVAQNELNDLLKLAEMLKVKGLVEESENGSQSGVAHDLRRGDALETSMSPPPAISTSTSTGGGGAGAHSSGHPSPPHSTGGYPSLYDKSMVPLDRGQSHLASSLVWPLPRLPLHSGACHQPTSSPVLGSGSYDSSYESSPLKRRKLMQQSTLLMNNDTPILRTVLGQVHADSSQTIPLLQPDSHESVVHYRTTSSNGSANDSDNRRSSDLAHGEAVHSVDVSYMDEDEKQRSPQSYAGDTKTGIADCIQPKPEWKRYKQYTKDDITAAIEAVKAGMSAVQAARKYGVPSRTLYDKVKKLGITTSRPFKRSTTNGAGGSSGAFPSGIGANVNGNIYSSIGGCTMHENENDNGNNGNVGIAENLAGTSASVFEAAVFEAAYAKVAKVAKDMSQSRDSMSDSMARCSSSPVIRCAKQKLQQQQQQQQQQQDVDDQVQDLSVSRKSDVPVIVPPSSTSVAINDEAQETMDNSDCYEYS